MIIVWGRVEAKPGQLDEVIRLSLEHVARSRKEAGCIRHDVHSEVENPNSLVFFEEWQDMSALRTHFSVPESGEFVAALSGLTTGDPEMKIYEAKLA